MFAMPLFFKTLSYARGVIILCAALGLAACQSATQDVNFPHDASDMPANDRVEYGVLENSLRYAVMSNATPSNTATLLMRIDTGSLYEKEDERGLAHFLEHMAFNGSENIPEGEMIKRLEKYGLAFGPDTNASTGFEETIYQLELPEVNDELINETLMIMRETASRLTLDPDAIDRERGIILAEKRARNSAPYKSSIASLSYFMEGSLFPERLPIGTEETINSVTAEQFRDFYHGFYRPEKTFVVLVGDFETDYGAEKIATYFADWDAVGEPRDPHLPDPLEPRGLDAEYYVDPEIQTSISINVTAPPDLREDTAKNREDFYIEVLGNRILSRRLSRMAQTVDSPFISAGAGTSNSYNIMSTSSLYMSSKPENWAEALAVGEQALRRAYLYGFTQAELDEQIANTRQNLQVMVQTSPTDRTPGLANDIMDHFSYGNVFTSPGFYLELFESYADDITIEQVHAAFKSEWEGYETPQIYLSTSEIIEDAETVILDTLKASQAVEVTSELAAELGEFAYTDFGPVGKVAERNTIEDIGIETVRFDNNVRLNIKKTPYQKDTISISVAFGQGELGLPRDLPGLRWFAPNIMGAGGLQAHSADDIQTLMAGKSVGVRFGLGTKRAFLSGATTPESLADQLNLMTAYLTAPGYRDEAMSRYQKSIESFYPTLDSTPGGVSSRDVPRIIRSGDTRFGVPAEEDLLGIEMQSLKDWITPSLRTSAIEIGVVGDVDVDMIIDEIARTFGALPEREPEHEVYASDVTNLTFPSGSKQPVTLSHAGEADTALLQVYWPGPDGRDDVTVREFNVLQAIFRNRLNDVLREELGSTYSPNAFTFMSRNYPEYGYFGVSVELTPSDVNTVQSRILDIAQEFQSGEITEDEFDRAITPIRENIEESLESNSYWMQVMGRAQSDPERLNWHRRRDVSYQNMTLNDIMAQSKTVFDNRKSVSIHILPEG